jgi:hypothetical protein
MALAIATAALLATAAGASPSLAPDAPRGGPPELVPFLPALLLDGSGARSRGAAASPCLGDMCPPRVSIPGKEPRYVRPSRSDLAFHYLDRMKLGPLSTAARGLLVTGLRLEYTPPQLEGPSTAPTRWGTVFLRVRFRIDAVNVPIRYAAPPAPARGNP